MLDINSMELEEPFKFNVIMLTKLERIRITEIMVSIFWRGKRSPKNNKFMKYFFIGG